MDRRTILILGILGAAGFGYWYYSKQKSSKTEQPTDYNYTNQPNLPVSEEPSVYVNGQQATPVQSMSASTSQAMPFPYNT